MYATEQTYVITYLAISVLTMHGCIGRLTIRTNNNYVCTIVKYVRSRKACPFGVLHTSRVGTGSSKLLSTLTDRFIAEANS